MCVNRPLILLIAGVLCAWLPARAQDAGNEPSAERWSVHFQATSIGQHHGSFPSLYEGENSLPSHPESRVSLTTTVFLAYRVNSWTELVFDPEVAGGKGFGQVTGIAGFTNGEIPRRFRSHADAIRGARIPEEHVGAQPRDRVGGRRPESTDRKSAG